MLPYLAAAAFNGRRLYMGGGGVSQFFDDVTRGL